MFVTNNNKMEAKSPSQPIVFQRIEALDVTLQFLIVVLQKTVTCYPIAEIIIKELKELQYENSRIQSTFGADAGDDEEYWFEAEEKLNERFASFVSITIQQLEKIIVVYNLRENEGFQPSLLKINFTIEILKMNGYR